MTVAGINTKVRRLLKDDKSPYRWNDGEIKDNLTFAIRELHKIRPETRYPNGSLVNSVALPSSDNVAIDIDDRFEECLMYYVVYLCYLDDDSDTVNSQLAEMYLNKFNTKAQI